jgi:hypothetical protein
MQHGAGAWRNRVLPDISDINRKCAARYHDTTQIAVSMLYQQHFQCKSAAVR